MENKEENKTIANTRNSSKKRAPIHTVRRMNTGVFEATNAIIVNKPKSSKDTSLIKSTLKDKIFFSLSSSSELQSPRTDRHIEEDLDSVVQKMKYYTLSPHEVIYEQGQPGINFFIISSGEVELVKNSHRTKILDRGKSFGEKALMHDSVRLETVITLERTTMWGLDRMTFREAIESVNAQNYEENKKFIESVPIFRVLTSFQKESLLSSMYVIKYAPGERIVNEGDEGDAFFIIKEGTVLCEKGGKELRKMNRGDFFGDQALLYNSVRTASVIAVSEAKCISIKREKLTDALGSNLQQIIYENSKRIAIEKSEALASLSPEQLKNVSGRLEVRNYKKGAVLFSRGSKKGDKLGFVLKGKVRIPGFDEIAGVFDCVGDREMKEMSLEVYQDHVVCEEDCDIGVITRENIELCIGGVLEQATANNEALNVLKNVQILRGLSSEKLKQLILKLHLEEFSDYEVIVQQDTPGDTFYIVKSGKVDVIIDGNTIRNITKLDYFGERSVLFNENRTATVMATGKVVCWTLKQSEFHQIIDEPMRQHIIKRIELQDYNVALSNLVIVKLLGKGMFGNVFLVSEKNRSKLYALKTVSRKKISRFEIHENLILERKILLQLDHQLILKLVKTFKDSKRIYFLTEFVQGLDLFDVLRHLNLLQEEAARFYTGCLALMLEHLHEREIIYRDLKPENIMVDEEGYPKLIDFGIAKIVQGRTYTVVGTPHYTAPEVILGRGYGFAIDYWSAGVLLFEFVCGKLPFGDDEEDPYKIYRRVVEENLNFPGYVRENLPSKSIITQLLRKNPESRLGVVNSMKLHEWFDNFDWDLLVSRQMDPPFKPKMQDLSQEILKAREENKDLSDQIRLEEKSDDPLIRNRKSKLSENWDWEF
jgi:cGMP-dependent protein kinase